MARIFTGLFGSKKQTQQPSTALRIQTSLQGIPIAIILAGQNRVPGNCIWTGGFNYQSAPSQGGSAKGGSSGAGGKGSSGQYIYYTDIIFAVCEGPVASFQGVFRNGSYTPAKQFNSNWATFLGSYTQDVWGYLEATYPDEALNYRGIVYVGMDQLDLGSSTDLPQFNWEILSVNNTAVPGQPDGDPKDALITFLTNEFFGLDFPSSRLDQQMTAYSSYCRALGLVVSPVLASATAAGSFLGDLLSATNSDAAWYDGFLTVVPRGDQAVTAGAIQSIVETHVVPAKGSAPVSNPPPYNVIIPGFIGSYVRDQGVKYHATGSPLTYTNAYPPNAAGQYTIINNGWYVFHNGDLGQTVDISYEYAATASYTPNLTPLWDFTLDDFLPNQGTIGQGVESGKNAIIVVRKPRDQMLNSIKLTYHDRNNNYNPVLIEVKDEASITAFKRYRPSDVKDLTFFCLASAAQQSAMLQLIREAIPNTFQWTAGKRFILCTVTSLVTLTGSTSDGRQLNRQLVKITEVQENADSTLTFTAELFPGTAAAPQFGTQASLGMQLDFDGDPGLINQPIIFEPPDELASALISGGGLMICAAVSGDDPAIWGGARVFASYDNATYNYVGTISGPARMGVTTADFPVVSVNPAGQTIDQTNTLSVDLTESQGALVSGTALDATSLNTKCYVGPFNGGGEIVAFETATLTATYKYGLTYLVRGAFGTESDIIDHPTGSAFCRIDGQVIAIPYDQSRIGATLYLKFCSFNKYQGGLQELSEVAAVTYVIQGTALASPLPNVTNLRAVYNNQTGFTDLYWDNVADFRNGIIYEVRSGTSWDAASTLGTVAHAPFTVPGNGEFWVAARVQPAAGLTVYSETPQSITIEGAVITQNVILTIDLAAEKWPGTFFGAIGVDSSLNALRTTGSGNILTDPDILHTPDVLNYSGASPQDLYAQGDLYQLADLYGFLSPGENVSGGIYYPANAFVDFGYVANASVSIKYQPTGVPVGQNILTVTNILATPDILGSASAQYVNAYPLINAASSLGGDLYSLGDLYQYPDLYDAADFAWNGWQKFAPGTYQALALNFAFFLQTIDPNTEGYNLEFAITVTIPARVDQYQVTTSAAADTTITFQPATANVAQPFNGGSSPALSGTYTPPGLPAITEAIVNKQPGDDLIITALSLSSVSFNVQNGGSRVVRALTLFAEGY